MGGIHWLIAIGVSVLGMGNRPPVPKANNHLMLEDHYFSEAFIYGYIDLKGEYQEVWFCYNPNTKEILYVPQHKKLQAVISFPDGTYKGYFIDENGQKKTIQQFVPEVTDNQHLDEEYQTIPNPSDVIRRKRIYQEEEEIISSSLVLLHRSSGEKQHIYVTENFSINSYQIYGFSRLKGLLRIPFSLDFMGKVSQKQLVTDLVGPQTLIPKFTDHTATVYYFDTTGYP